MSDPVLTTLCGVCRAVPPRYRCPRCGIRYCSVDCSRLHRARAGCTGIRDVTAYVPRARLCTPAGIDHDYNFFRGIELARARNERHLIEERRLLRSADLRPTVLGEDDRQRGGGGGGGGMGRGRGRGRAGGGTRGANGRGGAASSRQSSSLVLQKQWHGDEQRFVPVVDRRGGAAHVLSSSGGGGPGGLSKKVRALCRRDGVELLAGPSGLARQRENSTTVATLAIPGGGGRNKSKSRNENERDGGQAHLHWQVEWLVYEDGLAAKPTRILRRLLDHVPLCRGYAAMMAWVLQKSGTSAVQEVDEEAGERRQGGEGEGGEADEELTSKETKKRRRIHPLQQQQQQQQQQPGKRRRTGGGPSVQREQSGQRLDGLDPLDRLDGFSAAYAWQDPATGAWQERAALGEESEEDDDDDDDDDDEDEDAASARQNLLFFLLRPPLLADQAPADVDADGADAADSATADGRPHKPPGKELIPLSPGDTLASALRGRSVLEFPTICVLPRPAEAAEEHGGQRASPSAAPAVQLPPGHVLGSTERRPVAVSDGDARGAAGWPARQEAAAGSTRIDRRSSATAAAMTDSDTSSLGTTSSEGEGSSGEEEEEEDVVDDDDDGDADMDADMDAGGDGRPLLRGLNGLNSSIGAGKPMLVVYESGSEGSADEGAEERAQERPKGQAVVAGENGRK